MTDVTTPTATAMLSSCQVTDLVRLLDMTGEFLALSSPRVGTELSAYLADFHPHLQRREFLDLLATHAVELLAALHHSDDTEATEAREISVSSLTTDRIRETATKLALPHLAETISDLAARAAAAQMGYLDFVDLLLEEELGLREGRRFRNALKLSGLPHHKSLEEFDFTFQPDLEPRKVRDLATLEFVRAKANVALLGPPGVGKTMIAVALAVAACQAGFSIYFTTLDDLVRKLRAAEATGRFNRQLAVFLRPAVLVVDEVGYLPLDRAEANMVFQLVSRRYERGSMIITSNKSFAEWGSVLGDDVLATAILDRLLHHCDVLTINGPSYRLKDRMSLVATGGDAMP